MIPLWKLKRNGAMEAPKNPRHYKVQRVQGGSECVQCWGRPLPWQHSCLPTVIAQPRSVVLLHYAELDDSSSGTYQSGLALSFRQKEHSELHRCTEGAEGLNLNPKALERPDEPNDSKRVCVLGPSLKTPNLGATGRPPARAAPRRCRRSWQHLCQFGPLDLLWVHRPVWGHKPYGGCVGKSWEFFCLQGFRSAESTVSLFLGPKAQRSENETLGTRQDESHEPGRKLQATAPPPAQAATQCAEHARCVQRACFAGVGRSRDIELRLASQGIADFMCC